MTSSGWLQLGFVILLIGISTPLLGSYMAKVFGGGKAPGDKVFGPVERLIYRVGGVDEEKEQRWTTYAYSLLAFSFVSVVVLYGFLRLQDHLPWNPDGQSAIRPDLAFNTAVSFLTNTNWQNYGGESAVSHLTQMAGLAFHNFVSAAMGAAVAIAFIRGITRRRAATIGNFWVDLTRTCTRILLPFCFVLALVFVSQGMIQNLDGQKSVTTVAGQESSVPGGPVASQEAIKEVGENGGGFYNANSAHPFENPNAITNALEIWALLAIPFAFTYTFGKLAGDKRQGWVVFATMFALWFIMTALVMPLETNGNPKLTAAGATVTATANDPGGNMEGKETRFGAAGCGLFASSTTGTSTGSVNCAHDSLTPLGGAVPLVNMKFGEVSPGGTGSGMYGMLIFALLAVFIAGLMVGRTPEYLGKKIQATEMKLVVLYILFVPIVILGFTSISVVSGFALSSLGNDGPHGLTEMVYAFTSVSNNNGSAFGALTGDTQWFNITFAVSMLVGRFLLMLPVLAIAGSLAGKQRVPASAGTFPTGTPLFAGLLFGVVLIVVGLTYFPVVALGPIVEHLTGGF
jgi:K+-transporting ATPase ATPase A chain